MAILSPAMEAPSPLVPPKPQQTKPDPQYCPICSERCLFPTVIIDEKHGKRVWLHCECGTIWQPNLEDQLPVPLYDRSQDYIKWMKEPMWLQDRLIYLKRIYMPWIEDAMNGRKVLDINYVHHYGLDWMRDRGWITFGLDDCQASDPGDHESSKEDFLEHAFCPPLDEFSLVWMQGLIQRYEHPMPAVIKAFRLLESGGMLFASSPETSYLHRKGKPEFGHFHAAANRLMLRGEMFAKLAESIGFNTVMTRKSDSRKGFCWGEFHYLGMKP